MALVSTSFDSIIPFFERAISKNEARFLAKLMINQPDKLAELIGFISDNNPKTAMRASWIVGTVWELEPTLLKAYQSDLIRIVLKTNSDSVRRNILRIIENEPIPEEFLGVLFDTCLTWMKSENYAIAVRCNAMQILYRICCVEPGLATELSEQIRLITDFGGPGLKSRSAILLKKLTQLKD